MAQCERGVVAVLLAAHIGLLAWGGWVHSPTFNEVGHLPAGVSHISMGRFELYRANPPLVRCLAAAPVLLLEPRTEWRRFVTGPLANCTIPVAMDFVNANGYRTLWLYRVGRWACIPFSVCGAWLIWRLARELYGAASGLLAMSLWCFSPDILGHGATMMPDVPAAVMALAACATFWHWMSRPKWDRALVGGVVLGLAELTKFTLVCLYPVALLVWVVWRRRTPARGEGMSMGREAAMVAAMFGLSLIVINMGYGWEGTCRRLGDFHFRSRTLTGATESGNGLSQNRFNGSLAGRLPIPLPGDYLQGIDKQKADFEGGMRSYLGGEWKDSGWWYFYLYALAIKVPLGTWCLFGLSVVATLACGPYRRMWRTECAMAVPVLTILTAVSLQTGFSVHARYVLPIMPFLFVWISKIGMAFQWRHRTLSLLTMPLLIWSLISSLCIFPHSISYFNEVARGPRHGARHLLDSGIAWGQDLLLLKRWYDDHPEARPFHLASFGWVDPQILGIEFRVPPVGPSAADAQGELERKDPGPRSGWYAVDVNYLHGSDWPILDGTGGMYWPARNGQNFEYFRRFEPIASAGYSIYIYRITERDANGARKALRMAEL